MSYPERTTSFQLGHGDVQALELKVLRKRLISVRPSEGWNIALLSDPDRAFPQDSGATRLWRQRAVSLSGQPGD